VVKKGDSILFMSTQERYEATELGIFTPARVQVENLAAGEVGYLAGSIKTLAQVPVGDTITDFHKPAGEPLPGYKKVKPMVFCGLYPANAEDFSELTEALEKLRLNDPSFSYVGENSAALGFGYRLGFLGLLHMEVVQERLEREFGLTLVTTTPNVEYRVLLTDGTYVEVDNPSAMPDPAKIELVEEPYIRATIVVAAEHLGAVMKLCQDKRGIYEDLVYLDERRAMIKYLLPLAEIVLDFYDRLKSLSHGYAGLDYDYVGHRQSDLVKLDLLINSKIVDALSIVVHKDAAYTRGRALAARLRKLIPRQLFEVVIQAAISSRIIAREVVKPLRKDVIAKCYGGDITRKRKLLDKQREGKKRMKRVGNVDIPQEAFMAVLSVEEK
jgi:GTP-binding protein LepA